MRERFRMNPRIAVGGAACALIILGACSGTGFDYVKSGEVAGAQEVAYFKLPDHWTTFDLDQLRMSQSQRTAEDEQLANILLGEGWTLGFDGDPSPSPEHLLKPNDHPSGLAVVRKLTLFSGGETFSPDDLKNSLFPLEQMEATPGFELDESKLKFGSNVEGVRLSYSVPTDDGDVMIEQVGAYDVQEHVVYVFALGCNTACFDDNQKLIRNLINTWTVEGPVQ